MTIRKALVALLIGFTLGLYVDFANAQESTPTNPGEQYSIFKMRVLNTETNQVETILFFNGGFGRGAAANLDAAILANPGITKVAMQSPGGIAYEGFAMADVLSKRKMNVWIPRQSFCLSACAIAFLGGNNYEVDGLLGFHNAWVDLSDEEKAKNFDRYHGSGQFIGGRWVYHVLANGFSIDLAFDILANTTRSKFGIIDSTEGLNAYFIRDESDKLEDYMTERSSVKYLESVEIGAELALRAQNPAENPRYTLVAVDARVYPAMPAVDEDGRTADDLRR